MKKLYLIRHAKSSWKEDGLSDFDRPLNKRGQADAPEMGRRLREAGVRPDVLISSPANRAITTAITIANAVGFPAEHVQTREAMYLAGTTSLMEILKGIENRHMLAFMFGHNPGFTDLANQLSNVRIDNIPTCGIFCVQFDVENWADIEAGAGKWLSFDYPKKIL